MRALTVVAVLLASGARSLCAQHGGQIEIGGFGSYTRYDSRFQLVQPVRRRCWLGYFLGDHFSLEGRRQRASRRSTFTGVGRPGRVRQCQPGDELRRFYILAAFAPPHGGRAHRTPPP